eukprot:763826-Hanusia_phi.AAC.1
MQYRDESDAMQCTFMTKKLANHPQQFVEFLATSFLCKDGHRLNLFPSSWFKTAEHIRIMLNDII